MIDNTTS